MDEQYARYKKLIDDFLEKLWDGDELKLTQAMRYSLLSGSKRIRPVITLAFCELCGGEAEKALPAACAIELIHTYSLIHDDLPCMDNDDFRRGKPTNHKVYGEAMALLAGDGLLSYAQLLALMNPEAAQEITLAAFNMVHGQAMELDGCEDTRAVKKLKTGAMFIAAATSGCLIAGANKEKYDAAAEYASCLGLAFQYRDDILDSESNCQSIVDELTKRARDALTPFENNTFLIELTDYLAKRNV